MDTREIEAALLDFVRRDIFTAGSDITLESDLTAAGLDSMSLVRLLLFIETTYGFWIPANEISPETLTNLHTIAATVERLLRERPPTPPPCSPDGPTDDPVH